MKKKVQRALLAGCFAIGFGSVAGAQLPSEKASPVTLSTVLKERMAQQPPASVQAVLPSEGKKLPKGATLGRGQLPSNATTPGLSVADRRKKLPSSARNPAVSLKRVRSK